MVSWNGTVTLTDMPAVTVPNSAGNIAFDITAAAKAWKNETYSASSGLMLKNSNESSSSYYKIFTSTEYGSYYGTHMPYTVVNYNDQPIAVAGITSGKVYAIKNHVSGKYLNTGSTETSVILQKNGSNYTEGQDWKIEKLYDNYYMIYSMKFDKYLSIDGNYNLILEGCNSIDRERWLIFYKNGKYRLIYKSKRDKMMSVANSSDGTVVNLSTSFTYSEWVVEGAYVEGVDYTYSPYNENCGYYTSAIEVNLSGTGDYEDYALDTMNAWSGSSDDLSIVENSNSENEIWIYNYLWAPEDELGCYESKTKNDTRTTKFKIKVHLAHVNNYIDADPFIDNGGYFNLERELTSTEKGIVFRNVISHEIGHAFGLDDNPTGATTIMRYTFPDDYITYSPQPPDIEGAVNFN